ncbi:hypothetical protein F4805DRAFT_476879 [Annulohypoxylon moriforme]|nr:hypothetical protein F4805DRAFT_476879 [Annulohypoxylon moriforme]
MATGPQAFYCLWQKEQIRERLFELLSKRDICNIRLASSACCNLVTKRLFLRTHLTFTAQTFTRQSRIEALSRVGQHIEHLTFYFAHSDATFLPPLIHPESGREISFLYKPHTSMASVLERPKFANSGLGEILTDQYPPLFHAASNVPSFINAMKYLPNMRHLTIKTPGQDPRERYRRDIVDYALISLRISLERAPVRKLTKLSLSSVHPSAFIYLRHVIGFGCLPSAARRWKQIRKLNINVESWDFYGPSPGLDHLKMLDDYIRDFSTSLEKLTFTWLGQKGPCPLSLAADPLFAPPRSSQKLFHEVTSPMSPLPPAPLRKPIVFRKLRYMAIRNSTMNSPQVASLVATHQHSVREFDFENTVLINDGSWDDALAPLMENTSRSGRWTRHSMATISEEVASVHSEDVDDELSEDSPAVSAVSQELLDLDLNAGEGGEHQEREDDEPPAQEEEDLLDLPSDLEAARQASISFPNMLKKRRVTKKRRRRKPKHEHHTEDEREHRERHHRRQLSEDSIDQPIHERRRHRRHKEPKTKEPLEELPEVHPCDYDYRPSIESFTRPQEPPRLSVSSQTSRPRLFGEVNSVYSTTSSSRRLFGEVSQLSNPGSEPELTNSPIDESDSVVDDYFRPSTPTTITPMDISAPILNTAPSMPILLSPNVYDPTAELCSEITAVQRDIEAEEAQRLVAEDSEMQTSALRRAKELVLSRLGSQFSSGASSCYSKKSGFGGGGGLRKESFGAGGFLSGARFREGLFGRGGVALRFIWPYTRLYITGDDPFATRFLHATRGKPAWALVADAMAPVNRELCAELAAKGFNIVLYGREQQEKEGSENREKQEMHDMEKRLVDLRAELTRRFPENKYRVIIANAGVDNGEARGGEGEDRFTAQVIRSLGDVNLTVVINNSNADKDGMAIPARLAEALIPILRRNTPALVVNVMSSSSAAGTKESCFLCESNKASSLDKDGGGVDLVSCRIGEVAGTGQRTSILCPTPRGMARAVLAHAGYRGGGRGARVVMYPYWPHGLLQGIREVLPKQAVDRVFVLFERI